MRTITETITCDECKEQTVRVYNESAELDVTATIPANWIGRPRDLCRKCMVAALRRRANEIERGDR